MDKRVLFEIRENDSVLTSGAVLDALFVILSRYSSGLSRPHIAIMKKTEHGHSLLSPSPVGPEIHFCFYLDQSSSRQCTNTYLLVYPYPLVSLGGFDYIWR